MREPCSQDTPLAENGSAAKSRELSTATSWEISSQEHALTLSVIVSVVAKYWAMIGQKRGDWVAELTAMPETVEYTVLYNPVKL